MLDFLFLFQLHYIRIINEIVQLCAPLHPSKHQVAFVPFYIVSVAYQFVPAASRI